MITTVPHILKNNNFLKLWGSQLLLQIGFNISNYTVLLILANTYHSTFIQAQFFVALTIPAFLFGIFAGPIVDVVNRKKLMVVASMLLALLFLSYIVAGVSFAPLALIAFLTSSVARFIIPAQFATLPLIVKQEDLESANAMFLFTLIGAVLVGYAIAGPLIQVFGGFENRAEKVPFLVSSCMLFVGFLLLTKLSVIKQPYVKLQALSFAEDIMVLFSQTIAAIKKDSILSASITLLVFIELMIGFLSIVLLEYVRQYLFLPLTSVSYVFILPLLCGLGVGVLVLKKIEKKYGYFGSIGIACLCTGIALFVMSTSPFILAPGMLRIMAVLVSFLLGIIFVIIAVQSRTLLQLHTPKAMQGRIFSFLDIMIALVTPLPVLVLGALANTISILLTLQFFGIGVVVATLLGSFFVKENVRSDMAHQ
jgi:MFS family permease